MAEWYKLKQTAYSKWFYRFHLVAELVWWSDVWLPSPPHLVFTGLWSLWCCLALLTLTGWLCRSSLLGWLWQDQRAQRLGKLWNSAPGAFWGDKLQPCRGGWVSWAQKSCRAEGAASKSGGRAALSPGLLWEGSRNGICHLDNSDSPTHLFNTSKGNLWNFQVENLFFRWEENNLYFLFCRVAPRSVDARASPNSADFINTHSGDLKLAPKTYCE